MGSRLNVRCVKTPSEEGGTIPALGNGAAFEDPLDSDEGRWSSAWSVNSAGSFIVCFGVALAAMGTGTLVFQRAAHLTHLRKDMVTGWHAFGKSMENQTIPDPTLAKPEGLSFPCERYFMHITNFCLCFYLGFRKKVERSPSCP